MKIKKSLTQKVLDANRQNSAKSTGPRNVAAVQCNAAKHRLCAKHLRFQSPEEESEYNDLMTDLADDWQPLGRTEWALVEELGVILWNLPIASGWEQRALLDRRQVATAILRAATDNHYDAQLALFSKGQESRSAAQFGWDCQELTVRTNTRNSEQENDDGDKKGTGGGVQIEVKLNISLDSILRYRSALMRDLHRVIATLRALQRQRHGDSDTGDDE